jgi:hypothetical protein
MRERVYDLIGAGGRPTVDEIAERLGISVPMVNVHIASLRSGRPEDEGRPGRPSSGPTEPIYLVCERITETGRWEYFIPEEVAGGNKWSARRERIIASQLRRLSGMLRVWHDKYPDDLFVRRAHRDVTRLVEDLDDAMLRQESGL